MIGAKKILNGSRHHDHAPIRRGLSTLGWDLQWSTYVR